jgi:hypothetical protein
MFHSGTPFYACHFGFVFSARQEEKPNRVQIFKMAKPGRDKNVTGDFLKAEKYLMSSGKNPLSENTSGVS